MKNKEEFVGNNNKLFFLQKNLCLLLQKIIINSKSISKEINIEKYIDLILSFFENKNNIFEEGLSCLAKGLGLFKKLKIL